MKKTRQHRGFKIILEGLDEVKTLNHFINLAKSYANKTYTNEWEEFEAKEAYNLIKEEKIIMCRNGYAVLEDGTIKCTPRVSSWVAQFDGCTEAEMRGEYSLAIRGY